MNPQLLRRRFLSILARPTEFASKFYFKTPQDAASALRSSTSSKKLSPLKIRAVINSLAAEPIVPDMCITICMYSLRAYSYKDRYMKELLKVTLFCYFSSFRNPLLRTTDRDWLNLAQVLGEKIDRLDHMSARDISNCLYGLHQFRMTSKYRDAEDILPALSRKVFLCFKSSTTHLHM